VVGVVGWVGWVGEEKRVGQVEAIGSVLMAVACCRG
jgi:hypothetical protein